MIEERRSVPAVIAALFLAGLMLAVAAAAQSVTENSSATPPPKPKQVATGEAEAKKLLLLMDKDQNGKVSRQEFMSFMGAEFNRLDTNHDGNLNVRELQKSRLQVADTGSESAKGKNVVAGETNARKLVRLMDKDQNGKVSREEFMNFMAAEFDRLDTNHDGELDVQELTKSQLYATGRGTHHR